MEVTEEYAALMALPEREIPLDRVALLVAAHAHRGLDIDGELARLDALAESCFAPTLDALVRHLFVDLGFRGNEEDYYDPRNSYLNDVTTRRTGIPITLAIVAMEVGRRLGVPLAGVSMPGHFLLRDRVDLELFVDPFVGGAYLRRADCERAFRAAHGANAPFDPDHLEPVGAHAIAARLLANLKAIFMARSDAASLDWVLELRSRTPGVPSGEREGFAGALTAMRARLN
jgi:regulator of sirC expression with transglutaminase-like and TPR domain